MEGFLTGYMFGLEIIAILLGFVTLAATVLAKISRFSFMVKVLKFMPLIESIIQVLPTIGTNPKTKKMYEVLEQAKQALKAKGVDDKEIEEITTLEPKSL